METIESITAQIVKDLRTDAAKRNAEAMNELLARMRAGNGWGPTLEEITSGVKYTLSPMESDDGSPSVIIEEF